MPRNVLNTDTREKVTLNLPVELIEELDRVASATPGDTRTRVLVALLRESLKKTCPACGAEAD